MKTCQTTLSSPLLSSLATLVVTFTLGRLDSFQPSRKALSRTLRLPKTCIWILACAACGVLLALFLRRTHFRLTSPFRMIAEQGREGRLASNYASETTREARLIRDFIH